MHFHAGNHAGIHLRCTNLGSGVRPDGYLFALHFQQNTCHKKKIAQNK